jgi:hypothetical protein
VRLIEVDNGNYNLEINIMVSAELTVFAQPMSGSAALRVGE